MWHMMGRGYWRGGLGFFEGFNNGQDMTREGTTWKGGSRIRTPCWVGTNPVSKTNMFHDVSGTSNDVVENLQ